MELGRKSLESAWKSLKVTEIRTILRGSGRKKLKFLEFRQKTSLLVFVLLCPIRLFTFLFTLGIRFFATFSSRVRRSTDSRSFRDFFTQTENIFPSLWPSGFSVRSRVFTQSGESSTPRELFHRRVRFS